MNEETLALETYHTWEVTTLPLGKRAIDCKWVYELKLEDYGTIDKYNARLVAKGYNQIEGVDYVNSFSSVANTVTVHLLLTIAAARN
ncbi:Retrovirus-related Pol polyprotein from transposon RE2 [Sesamum angolense]|uniref:Retrovirus-related Pol polyprotein from transposon RE2 n=1 Tax=Sesamum angolense TaxID=2727404 RepID=A0AAE1X3I0_9LAMI|nr:Retrovirus-related Pol polyprotein from transposon RE2 [Sesamum angolense]